MNIRSISNPAQVLAKDKVQKENQAIKSDLTDEREGNGQQFLGGNGSEHRPLSEEEMKQVLDKLRSHEGIVLHNLQLIVSQENTKTIVCLKTQDGELVKRFLPADLFHYLYQEDKQALQLVKKTA